MHRRPPPVHPCDPSGRSYNSDREVAEFKKRQQIRENSVEIRELETKLRQGYINQELAVQVNLCQKLFFLQNMGRTCCVQKLFRKIIRWQKIVTKTKCVCTYAVLNEFDSI